MLSLSRTLEAYRPSPVLDRAIELGGEGWPFEVGGRARPLGIMPSVELVTEVGGVMSWFRGVGGTLGE